MVSDYLVYLSTAVLGVVVAALLYLWHWRNIRVYWMIRGIQSLSRIPLVGDAITLALLSPAEITEYFEELVRNGKRYYKAVLFGLPNIMLIHPDDIEVLLSSTVNIKKGFEYYPLQSWLKEGLLLSYGDKWRQRRKLLTPTFHFRILEDNVGQMAYNTKKFVKNLLDTNGSPFVLDDIVRKLTLEVICETAMGIDLSSQDDKGEEYVEAVKRLSDTTLWRTMNLWMTDAMFYLTSFGKTFRDDLKTLHTFTKQVIKTRKLKYEEKSENSENEKTHKKPKAFLDLLLEEDKHHLTSDDIQEEVDTFMFEGHDTTAAAIVHAMYLLAEHPDIQEEVYDEQQRIFGSEEREPTRHDLLEMVYLEMVIKETLRLFPSVPYISRTLTQDMTLADGKVVPAGVNAVVIPYLVHRNEKFWDDPKEFRPDRFLPGTKRHPYSYIPFSAGSRNCIGMKFAMLEMKAALSEVVRNCRIESANTDIKMVFALILKNDKPIRVKIFPRKNK